MTDEILNMMGAIFLLMGVMDIIIAQMIFKKKKDQAEAAIPLHVSPSDREPFQKKAQAMALVQKALFFTGILFIFAGLYFLIR